MKFTALSEAYIIKSFSIRMNQQPVCGTRYVLKFLFSKNHKIAKNSATTGATEKTKYRYGILRI